MLIQHYPGDHISPVAVFRNKRMAERKAEKHNLRISSEHFRLEVMPFTLDLWIPDWTDTRKRNPKQMQMQTNPR